MSHQAHTTKSAKTWISTLGVSPHTDKYIKLSLEALFLVTLLHVVYLTYQNVKRDLLSPAADLLFVCSLAGRLELQ